ncbi:MAG: S-layer homology domain-containing protein, partial [Butyricicoccus sp.]
MKNLKKVLAMVLAFACTFTMFASAKVYEDVQPGSEFSEAITMLSDLGIIQGKTDGKYHPEETITRAEACALIARLLTGDPNVSNFGGAQNFTDVVKGSWQDSAIGYCVANGITVGVGNGKFEPNRAINDQEFLTMMVRALGYETPDVKQGYPFSYMTVANAIGLRQDTEMMANTDALRGEDAQVIYNAMFVDYAKGAKMINTTHGTSVEKYPTLAESVWGLDRAALGTFSGKEDDEVTLTNCKAHTWVIVGADKKAEGRVLAYPINDDTTDIYESDVKAANGTKYVPYSFKYEGDADALKGYQVELWGEGKHGTPTWEKGEGKFVYSDEWNIKAIKTVKGQTKYDYDASKADAKSDNGTIELGESKLDLGSVADNAKKVSAKNTTETTQTTYLSSEKYNGESVDKDKNVEKALNIRDGAQYKLMDWDSDGNIDWIVVDEANYFKVESANSKRLTVTSMKSSTKDGDEETQTGAETQTWKLDGLNDEKNYKVKFVAPEGVKEGDILEVTYKTAYDKGEKCEVVTATATVVDAENQELDKVSTKSNLVLTFNGETKQLAQNNDKADTIVPANPTKYIDFDEEELGTEFALYMNRNGFIVYSDYATESSNYLMVLDTDNGEDGARPKLGALKILTSDNKVEKNVEVVSDLRIDGKTSGNGYEKNSHSFVEDKIVGNVYKYWKDADGRITKMESMIDASKADNKANNYEYVSKNDRLTLDGKSYALKDAKVIFAVKPHDAGSDYIQHVSAVDNDKRVDEDDVIAVKAADIPDISKTDDTLPNTLDKNYQNSSLTMKKSWIGDDKSMVAIAADKNKDVDAAVLGVNNFNKFNAGSTKVGLVTNVSYDKNDVVSIDVATNGKVETLSSVEKTNFDDVVSVMDYTNKTTTKSYSVASRTEKITNGLMKDTTLKDYLNKNGAYAEITTNADGKLTGVMFMDTKKDNDGDANKAGVNAGNVVVGDYYQVSRKVVADVKEGSWMSVMEGSAEYADEDNFKSMDTKNEQKAADFTSDATYYLIDGKPTKHSGAYVGKASVVDGFDGNPDIKVAEASDVRKSDIRNDGDSA